MKSIPPTPFVRFPEFFSARPAMLVAAAALACSEAAGAAETKPAISYVGSEVADTRADGGLRPVVGAHNLQVVRANRTDSPHADGLTDTYLHAPMLAHWKGKFYLEYLSGPRDEHQPPCSTSLTTSTDGLSWEKPRTVFPSIKLPDGTQTVMHQRMGFYVAPDGRLLVLGFHGKPPSPNDGTGLGRVVREVKEDGTFGPIHFIRYNRHAGWNESNTPYPFYKSAADAGFVAACEALLSNKLMTAQWWEEDMAEDGFYTAKGKALSFFHRPDGAVVGIWKNAQTHLTTDNGHTWTKTLFAANLPVNASKYWAQRTSDGRFALVFNPTYRLRHPLAVTLSEDGENFSQLLALHGELPDQRFIGGFKNMGPQYVRGIVEGNGTPPDGALWVTYSVNKEDIWVSRAPVPLVSRVSEPVNETFDALAPGTMPATWNIYRPSWTSVQVVDSAGATGRALELRDEEPYDYARAVRVFPATHGMKASFKILPRQTNARLEIDLVGGAGERPIRFAFMEDGHLRACHEGIWQDAGTYAANAWITIDLTIARNPKSDRCEVLVNGKQALSRALVFTDPAESMERISFRTGAFRDRGVGGPDLPNADRRAPASVFLVDDVVVTPD